MAIVAQRCRVEGRVQGVGFRYFVQKHAQRMKLQGWVRNLPDGDVELHVEGDRDQVNQLIKKVNQGPSMAMVTGLDRSDAKEQGYEDFSIKR